MISKLKIYLIVSILLSITMLVFAFYSKGYLIIFPVIAGLIVFGFVTRKIPAEWPAMVLLGVVTFTAVGGVLQGVAPWLALSSGVFALIAWDLRMLFDRIKTEPAIPLMEQLVDKHIKTLVFAVAAGWLLVILANQVHLRFPFAVVVLLVLIIFFGLDRLVRWLTIEK